ncbi:MAG: dual specificity protein phosphatase family protein [Phycisphaerae bacterium]|nr:dual specificity protein phosphatase family protein [Phycisphaerae bacterium]
MESYITIILLLLAVTGLIAFAVYRHKIYYHFSTVEKGKIYRCGALALSGLKGICKRHQIRTIINLTRPKEYSEKPWYKDEVDFCHEHNIQLIHIPLMMSKAPTEEQVNEFLAIASSQEHQPVLVHCKQGVLRTGMMIAAYVKTQHGLDNESIMHAMPDFGHDFNSSRYKGFRDFVLNYEPDSTPVSTLHCCLGNDRDKTKKLDPALK